MFELVLNYVVLFGQFLFLLFSFSYLVYSVLIVRQTQHMSEVIKTPSTNIVKGVVLINALFSIIVTVGSVLNVVKEINGF